MSYSKVVAIINITDYGLISEPLMKLDIPGVTVSMVRGFGDYVNNFDPYGFSDNMKIEIYTLTEQASEIAEVLTRLADEMTEGGGIIAVEPVSQLMNVRKLNT